jgi:hypothetical protein
VYENIQWLPRFFAVSSYKVFASDADLLAALGQAPISELRSTAYISTSDAVRVGTVTNATVTAEVRLLRYGPNEVELEVDAAIPSLLVNTTTYSPFWKVEIDHSSSTVFPVDHTFQGVVVGPGKHRVVYRYEPVYAWWPK